MSIAKNHLLQTCLVICSFSISPNSFGQQPTENERWSKALVQIASAFAMKKGLDEDLACKNRNFADFSVDEIVAALPESEVPTEAKKLEAKKGIEKLVTAISEGVESDGQKMYKRIYAQTLASFRVGGVIPNTNDGHCSVLYQAARNVFQNAKNNLNLLKK
jgi:hypothetical protein